MIADPKTIVVAEDEPLIRLLASARFSEAGYNVIEAEHAAHALLALRCGGVHLLFTDVHMPGEMDGMALARWVRREWPTIHIIIASGEYRPPADEFPEGKTFFRKPYDLDHILAQARHLMAG